MFKYRDRVTVKYSGPVLKKGDTHTITWVSSCGIYVNIEYYPSHSFLANLFEPARQCNMSAANNPCITTEVITTTKRKVKSGRLSAGIALNRNGDLIWLSSTTQYISNANLRELAKQLNEIADVLDEAT